MSEIQDYLKACSLRHDHLCPRQVLGVRMGLAGAAAIGLAVPRQDKRLLVIAETDGCFVDGLEAAAGVSAGHRTLRIEDYGKVAATFVDVSTGEALRLAPRPGVRQRALDYAPGEPRHYFAQLYGYQVMPAEELFSVTAVTLTPPAGQLISQPGKRCICSVCGEEIINEREVYFQGIVYCRACFGQGYYQEPAAAAGILAVEQLMHAERESQWTSRSTATTRPAR